MKIYTKHGDQGNTQLPSGRVSKGCVNIDTCGNIDELIAFLGLTIAQIGNSPDLQPIRNQIVRIQHELFNVNACVAGMKSEIAKNAITTLEAEIDEIATRLPQLTHFILPGNDTVSALLHIARTVCRRTERSVVKLQQTEANDTAITYLNRLSDWLFTLARLAEKLFNEKQ